MRVLLTRAAAADDRTESELHALGAMVVTMPLVRIAPPADGCALVNAAKRADSYDWIAFTSVNGVEAFARARGHAGPSGTHAPAEALRARVAAVGDATARAVAQLLGRDADLVPSTFTAAALGEALAERVRDGEAILIVQAADARPDLARALSHVTPRPHVVVGYDTISIVPPETRAAIEDAHVIVLASGSAARSLAAALKPSAADALRDKVIACIGPVTADEARRNGIPVTIVAHESTMRGVIAALVEHAAAS
jgi:uroporphyrinogen-III synthase